MRIITADRRMVAVPHASGAGVFPVSTPPWAGQGTIRLARDAEGRRRRVSYAAVARANPWVLKAIARRAGTASRIPLHLFRPDQAGRDGYRERVRPGDPGPGGHLARVLQQPEPRVSARRWKRRLVGDVLTHGNGLCELVRDPATQTLLELRWHPWADVDPVLSEDRNRVEVFRVPIKRNLDTLGILPTPTSEMRPVDPRDALHLTLNDDTDKPLGVSPIASLHNTIALHEAAWRFAAAYLDQGMFPSGVVELPDKATIAQAQLTRELIEDLYVGPDRAGKPAIIGFGRWQQVAATPEGAKLVELAQASRDEVSAAYGIDLLADFSSANRATAHAARTQFIRDVVGEDVSILESEVNVQVIAQSRRWSEAGLFVEAEMGEMLRPDMETMSQVLERQTNAPVMTPNEGRRLINLAPLDDPRADQLQLNPGTPGAGPGAPADDADDGEE